MHLLIGIKLFFSKSVTLFLFGVPLCLSQYVQEQSFQKVSNEFTLCNSKMH